MTERYHERIWNQYDEMALLVGLSRIPGETNLELRERILNHATYDSTEQGLVNHISEALLTTGYQVAAKTVFTSLRQPLSLAEYNRLTDPTEDYYAPRVIVGATTWIITSGTSEQKDIKTSDGLTWTLWKQPDGVYDRIWTSSAEPSADVELSYQWKDDTGALHTIREKAKILTWEDAEITEAYPEEDE